MTDDRGPVAVLRDRQEVADTVARFCQCVDEYDIDGLRGVFTADVLTDYGPGRGGPVRGLEAVLVRIADGQSQFRRTHHQLGQSLIEVTDDRARACTYVTATHEELDGSLSRVHLRYVDVLARTADGWRIDERRVLAQVVEGFPGVPWNYVPRGEVPR